MANKDAAGRGAVTLSDGRALSLDMYRVTWNEAAQLLTMRVVSEEERAQYAGLIGKAYGLSADEMLALPFPDFRRLELALIAAYRAPVEADPN